MPTDFAIGVGLTMTLGTGIAIIFGFFGTVILRSAIIAFYPGSQLDLSNDDQRGARPR